MLNRDPITLSLYVHFPWCERKCPYCDFNSHVARDDISHDQYIDLLVADLERDLQQFNETRPLSSIFMGGGTPSLFSADSVATLLERIKSLIAFTPDIEITLEANPGSSENKKFAGFYQAGVNRLSIGVQSFNEQMLNRIGRVHNAQQAHQAIEAVSSAGFNNFNLDLMFGLPTQTIEEALEDVRQAIAYKPPHLSVYQLTYEPNTLFYHSRPKRADDDALYEMQLALQNELNLAHYQQYEVSAYSQLDKQCRHNLNYWRFGDYLGIGAGAHGKVTTQSGDVNRYWKKKHPKQYAQGIQGGFSGGSNTVPKEDLVFEGLMNGLRLCEGINTAELERTTGTKFVLDNAKLAKLAKQELLIHQDDFIKATPLGFTHLDTILATLMPD